MDTYMTITAFDGDKSSALSAAQQKVQSLEKLWSVTDENSEIYHINHSGGEAVMVSDETAE
ncbi:MAG: FAD:protein FMN transferase, partial [Ruminococcus sp.]|nr:FAD:protein FMN transferase [Ruminococcus sp.]